MLYDPEFTTNPLVFCGCIGSAADREPPTGPHPGDRVILLGGATGRDGIRGATFSSAAMDATTGEVAGASVQIGDPVTEKLLIDVLDGAEHLWTAITDCGAGGLSSAIGEMAEELGADVDLDAVPLKYPGLQPWEIWLSEAQERMVARRRRPTASTSCAGAAHRHRVDIADLGEFTGTATSSSARRRAGARPATRFLHDGRPQRRMTAIARRAGIDAGAGRRVDDPAATLLALLAHPNIASKAAVVHRYDHEIGGATLVRPLAGRRDDGPRRRRRPRPSRGRPRRRCRHRRQPVVRAARPQGDGRGRRRRGDPQRRRRRRRPRPCRPARQLLVGRPPGPGDARRSRRRRRRLLRRRRGVQRSVRVGQGLAQQHLRRQRWPAPRRPADAGRSPPSPTSPTSIRCVTPELAAPGNVARAPRRHRRALRRQPPRPARRRPPHAAAGSGIAPQLDPASPARYRALHRAIRAGLVAACHDVSEGGLAVALAEMCIASGLGVAIDALPHPDVTAALFSESAGRLVVEVAADDVEAHRIVGPVHVLGELTARPVLA